MAEAAWGTVTAKPTGGSSDPNVLKLGDQTRIRVVEGNARKWRQHGVTSPTDSEQFRSITCPRGADGRGNQPCPMCAKPQIRVPDPKDPTGETKVWKQLFPISRRFAVNVFDYESGEVKVLIAGPQVFEEFDSDAAVGNDPTTADYTIIKVGSGQQTKYKMRRMDSSPMPVTISPDMLHDLDKYEDVPSIEAIFKTLEDLGIDYDAIPIATLTLDEARAEVMPYTKHKGQTMEQLVANEADFLLWLYGQKRDQGQYGDPVFIAMHTVLFDAGLVPALDDIPAAPPRPTPVAVAQPTPVPVEVTATATVTGGDTGMVMLIPPTGGDPQPFPATTKDVLLASGFTEPPPPAPAKVKLVPPGGGDAIEFDGDQKAALLAAGFTEPEAAQAVPAPAPEPEPEATPLPPLPRDNDLVTVFVKREGQEDFRATLAFAPTRPLVDAGTARFDDDLMALIAAHEGGGAQTVVPTEAAPSPSSSGSSVPAPTNGQTPVNLDPALTTGPNEAGEFTHPAIEKSYKTKGAVTQALNRMAKEQAESAGAGQTAAAPTAAAPVPATGAPAVSADNPREALMDECRALLAQMPEVNSDFNQLLALFKEVANKQSIADFTDQELGALKTKLQERIAAKATA